MTSILFLLLPGMLTFGLSAAGDLPFHDEMPIQTATHYENHSDTIDFSPASASEYIKYLTERENLWRKESDTLRLSLKRLVDHYHMPYDSVIGQLKRFPYGSVALTPTVVVHSDTLPVRWLNRSTFIIDTTALEKEPYIIQKTIVIRALDNERSKLLWPAEGPIPEVQAVIDSILQIKDTITQYFVDTQYLESRKIQLYRTVNGMTDPPLVPPRGRKTARFLPDSARIVISEPFRAIVADKSSPFYIVPGENMPDSLRLAVKTLLDYTHERDSILFYLQNMDGATTPFWLTSSGRDELYRYWVRNAANDSVTIWIGNPAKLNMSIALEDNLGIERMEKRVVDQIQLPVAQPAMALAKATPLKEIPIYWKYGFVSSFTLNQNYLSNWARGGESSLTSMLDVNSSARYSNTENNVHWTSSGRLRYGTIRSKERGFRTSTDILELNSQYNKKLWKKFDFSSVLYAKSQIAKGFIPPNDSVPVSRFLSPGSITIGTGIEYKPSDRMAINFSMLSYRNTFVLDTLTINQTAYGIDKNKRARQEMGGQLMIRNTTNIIEGLTMTNAIRLFSNYLDKPQNVDIDWEMGFVQQINWYFTVRLNLHLIYDDDVRFPVLDQEGKPVLLPDGTPKRVARAQFNQFLGLTLSFRI